MRPLVDIHRRSRGGWTYVVGTATDTGVSIGTPPGSAIGMLEFTSLESCLADLGNALEPYFARVELKFGGRHLGSCATRLLRNAPRQLAARIHERGMTERG